MRTAAGWSDRAGPGGDYRVSAAERDAVVEELRQHTGDGRLTLDEFGERMEEALAARTRTELRAVLRELPRLRSSRRNQSMPTVSGGMEWLRRVPVPVMVFSLIAVVALLSGHWWVIFPLMWFGGGVLRPRRNAGRSHHDRRPVDEPA